MSWKFNLVLLSIISLCPVITHGKRAKVTNWRVELSTEFRKELLPDSLIKPHEASLEKGQEKVDTLWSKLKGILAKDTPASFFTNPPWAGELRLTVILRQKVSIKTARSGEGIRATEVAHEMLGGRPFPTDDRESQRQKEVETLRGKAKEYEFVGLKITVIDFVGKEVLSYWCAAEQDGKMKVKKCAPEIIRAMKLVAAQPNVPVLEQRRR